MAQSLELARREGIATGVSGGATVAAARSYLRTRHANDDDALVVAMLPDTVERYLSHPLFAQIEEGQDARLDEIEKGNL